MLGVSPAFWHGRPVLVTGHTGFKGGWLSLWLQRLGARVHGYALAPPTVPSLYVSARVGEGMEHTAGDLLDLASLEGAMARAQPEIVFHLAAQALVRDSYRDPLGTLAANVTGTANVLEVVRRVGSVRAVVIVTSDKCYINQEWPWPYRENEALGGRDPYSASKACAEIITAAWRASFFGDRVAVATARAGNVVGGGDWAVDRLVPDALRAWQSGAMMQVRNPNAERPWQYVLEPLAGYLRLAECLFQGECAQAWNFGPEEGDVVTVADLLARLGGIWGEGARWQADASEHPHEAGLLRLDSSLARQQLGWRSRCSLDQALRQVVAWHRAWIEGRDMRQFTLAQIEQYEAEQ